jgi:hypothetical protein
MKKGSAQPEAANYSCKAESLRRTYRKKGDTDKALQVQRIIASLKKRDASSW